MKQFLIVNSKRGWVDRETIKIDDRIMAEIEGVVFDVRYEHNAWSIISISGSVKATYGSDSFVEFVTYMNTIFPGIKFYKIEA